MMEDAIRKVLEDLFNLQPLMLNRSMGIAQNENFSPVQLYVLFTLQCREEMTLADCCRQTLIRLLALKKLLLPPCSARFPATSGNAGKKTSNSWN